MSTFNNDDYVYDYERELKAEAKAEAKAKAELKAYVERQNAEAEAKAKAELEEKLKLFPDPATSRKNDALLLDGNWDDDKWDFKLEPPSEADQKLIDAYDNINPKHYKRGDIEVIDFIEDQDFNYNRGQVIRYLSRAGHKPNNPELDDLKKALWYLEREIKNVTEKESDNV